MSVLIAKNTKLEVLNISNCVLLTNHSVLALAKYSKHLLSVNMSKCAKVTDTAIVALVTSCKLLHALNLAGLRKLTEVSLCAMAEHCRDTLLTLNITGCDLITNNGIAAIIAGFTYVQNAVSYIGFKPIDNYIELKLQSMNKFVLFVFDYIIWVCRR